MKQHLSIRLGLACAAALIFTSAAHAQEGVAMKDLLGTLGIIQPDRDPIRYRERAPLVLPPKMELREPAGSETFASNNPQWPNDPDVARRRNRAAEARVPVTDSEIRRMSERNVTLSPRELRAGRTATASQPGAHKSEKVEMTVEELRQGTISGEEETKEAAPVRRTLAEPPNVFRQSARGGRVEPTNQVRVDQQTIDSNPINWLTRAFKNDDDD